MGREKKGFAVFEDLLVTLLELGIVEEHSFRMNMVKKYAVKWCIR